MAGSHTTSGTLTLLFAHLLQHEQILKQVVTEMDAKLHHPSNVTGFIHAIEGLEHNLPYTMACIHENFRINAVFSMPLPRRVSAMGGMEIDGKFVPQNVRSAPASTVTRLLSSS